VADGVTDPVRTVIDCARDLPFDEALAVADSALRSGKVGPDALRQAAARSPRTGRDGRSGSPRPPTVVPPTRSSPSSVPSSWRCPVCPSNHR
jgi:hypothetical protein